MSLSRRRFLGECARGVLVGSVGSAVAGELGLAPAGAAGRAADGPERLTFGEREPLVRLMQETPAERLLPRLVEQIKGGTDPRQLVAAAALANARTFGGEDYVGFHTLMALAPAWHMARELPAERQALPVLKVIYRNAARCQEVGGAAKEVLRPVAAAALPAGAAPVGAAPVGAAPVREAVRRKDVAAAEGAAAAVARAGADALLDAVLEAVEDATEVHRVVLPYRAWDLLPVVGADHALTLLRQSVRYCVKSEGEGWTGRYAAVRTLLPELLARHGLLGPVKAARPAGAPAGAPAGRPADGARVRALSEAIFKASAADAAGLAAEALAGGVAPEAVGEAVSLAANQLVLRDNGRPQAAGPNKPAGSIHGDSIGVHACDSANAWRNLARVGTGKHRAACLILGAYQAALDRTDRGGDFLSWEPYPRAEARGRVTATDPAVLLKELDGAIRERDQARAAAVAARYGELGHADRPMFDLLLGYAVSEDGALHAEKYYRTVVEEYGATHPEARWRQVVALARVTASAYGQPAPGHAEACRLLRV